MDMAILKVGRVILTKFLHINLMKLRNLLLSGVACLASFTLFGAETDSEGYPIFYVRGSINGMNWEVNQAYRFERSGDTYKLALDAFQGEFKISNDDWSLNYGANGAQISGASTITGVYGAPNIYSSLSQPVEISFNFDRNNPTGETPINFRVDGVVPPPPIEMKDHSGTLPVLYINVYDEAGNLNNEITDYNLSHKNYFAGEYWLEADGLDLPFKTESIGSREEPLPLEIKARGNWTRTGFSKKPFKLKLGKKQSMLGMTKSKHYAILAHADDNFGYLRNFTGFNLGRIFQLPWTPDQQPIEVYINGNYRGLYFLTESIRVGDDRVMIEELEDNETNASLISGGYLVELDNYEEENQIRMQEKTCAWVPYVDELRITFDTPEVYSEKQRMFIYDQFSAMNDLVGANSDDLWKYMDLDDAARYYLVEEIISHYEAYHGSTYLFRDRGEGQKWHFSPLWDCGNAFNGPTDDFFYNHGPYGNTWIASIRQNAKFNEKVRQSWLWFLSQDGEQKILDMMKDYVSILGEAAKADRKRWVNEPTPWNGLPVVDNTDLNSRLQDATSSLRRKIEFLKQCFGSCGTGEYGEPARDTTPAAPLPQYVSTGIEHPESEVSGEVELFNLQGVRLSQPVEGEIMVVRKGSEVSKEIR